MKNKNNKGFTLTELIVVIVIIGILACVLVPSLTGYIDKAKVAAAEKEGASYVTAYCTWQIEEEVPSEDGEKLTSFKTYLEEIGLEDSSITAVDSDGFTFTASNEISLDYSKTAGFVKA